MIIKESFLRKFYEAPLWKVIEKGRLCSLRLNGQHGSLLLVPAYLDPRDVRARCQTIQRISRLVDPAAHTIVLGDFNFVAVESDRISKNCASCQLNSRDRANADTWANCMTLSSLREFAQDKYTCENSWDGCE